MVIIRVQRYTFFFYWQKNLKKTKKKYCFIGTFQLMKTGLTPKDFTVLQTDLKTFGKELSIT